MRGDLAGDGCGIGAGGGFDSEIGAGCLIRMRSPDGGEESSAPRRVVRRCLEADGFVGEEA